MQSLAVLIAAASLVATGPAPQPTMPRQLPPPAMEARGVPADSNIHRQLDRIDKTIRAARKSRELSRKEAKSLRGETARLRRFANVGFSPLPRAQLENQVYILRDAVNVRTRTSEPHLVAADSPEAGR